jgi:hypothetical protein
MRVGPDTSWARLVEVGAGNGLGRIVITMALEEDGGPRPLTDRREEVLPSNGGMGARAYGAQRVGFRAQAWLSTILCRVHRRPTVVYGGCGRGRDRGVGRDSVATRYAQVSRDTGTWRRHASDG